MRRFETALRTSPLPMPVICDIKLRSPGEGDLIRGRDPVALAKTLIQAGAPALSVVTEGRHYGGDLRLLEALAKLGTPVLRKDFLSTPADLEETLRAGASAVLLIVSTMDETLLRELYQGALELGLEPLVETHTPAEMALARNLAPRLVGINNRDIGRLETDAGDVSGTERLAAAAPRGALLIAESALVTPEDVSRARAAGAGAALVGTAILRAGDPARALRQLSLCEGGQA